MADEPLKCDDCGQPWVVTRTQTGYIAVRPQGWWQPASETWTATCACLVGNTARGLARPNREVSARSEGDLYRALGYPYA